MPNTFEYADWLAMESLDLLESKRAVSQFFNTDYDTDDSDFEDLMDDHAIHESLVKWAREV